MSFFASRPVLSSCAEWNLQQPLGCVHWGVAGTLTSASVHYCCVLWAQRPRMPSSSLWRFRRTHLLISAPPVQSPQCGVRSGAPCCSRGGTWRRGPPWWRWLCRTWSASSNGPSFFGPTGFCTASTVSSELPAPECHTKQTLRGILGRWCVFFHKQSLTCSMQMDQKPKSFFFLTSSRKSIFFCFCWSAPLCPQNDSSRPPRLHTNQYVVTVQGDRCRACMCSLYLVTLLIKLTVMWSDACIIAAAYVECSNLSRVCRC